MAESRKSHFFHGTTYDIPVGDNILPGNKVGHSIWGSVGHSGQRSDDNAFATTNEGVAWDMADRGGRDRRAQHRGEPDVHEAPGRSAVYEVAPTPGMRPGVYNPLHPKFENDPMGAHDNYEEYVAPKFKTTSRIDIKPGHQGTFPQVNWNQFAHSNMGMYEDANHPSDQSIAEGHELQHQPPVSPESRNAAFDAKIEQRRADEQYAAGQPELPIQVGLYRNKEN